MALSERAFTFTWNIENFSMAPHGEHNSLESPTFVVETLAKSKWCLALYPKGILDRTSDNTGGYLALYLWRADFGMNYKVLKINFYCVIKSADSALNLQLPLIEKVFDTGHKGFGYSHIHGSDIFGKKLTKDVLTIWCHMWPSEKIDNILAEPTLTNCFGNRCSARTRIGVQRRTLIWPITKVNEIKESHEKVSITLVNSLDAFPDLKLTFYTDKFQKYARIEISPIMIYAGLERLFTKCKITVASADREHQVYEEDSHLFNSSLDEIWHFPEFIAIQNLTDDKYVYLDNTMFLQIELTFPYERCKCDSELLKYAPSTFQAKAASGSSQLSNKVQQLLVSKRFCDVEIRVGVKSFPCHKLVLCALSPVFNAMFENDLKEKRTGVVEISDFEPRTIELMLAFMYSSAKVDNLSTAEICQLYSAADKYEFVPLQRHCSILLASTLSVESICCILAFAHRHQEDNFLWLHINNFLSIHSNKIFHSPQWKIFEVDNPEVSKEIIVKFFKANFL